jgi:hypothetical protein
MLRWRFAVAYKNVRPLKLKFAALLGRVKTFNYFCAAFFGVKAL